MRSSNSRDGLETAPAFSEEPKQETVLARVRLEFWINQTVRGAVELPLGSTAARPSSTRCAESCGPSAIFPRTHEAAKRSRQTARSLQRVRKVNVERCNNPGGADVTSTSPFRKPLKAKRYELESRD